MRGAITNGKHLDLMEHDQLHQEKLAGHAFIGFHEADITFKPTYKFDPGLSNIMFLMMFINQCSMFISFSDKITAEVSE